MAVKIETETVVKELDYPQQIFFQEEMRKNAEQYISGIKSAHSEKRYLEEKINDLLFLLGCSFIVVICLAFGYAALMF